MNGNPCLLTLERSYKKAKLVWYALKPRHEAPGRFGYILHLVDKSSSGLECTVPPDSIENINRALFVSIGQFFVGRRTSSWSSFVLYSANTPHSSSQCPRGEKRRARSKRKRPPSCLFSRSLANLIPMRCCFWMVSLFASLDLATTATKSIYEAPEVTQ